MSGEVKPGQRVGFVEPGEREGVTLGTVNGAPWVAWNGTFAAARIPVYTDDHRCIDVAGVNLREVHDA